MHQAAQESDIIIVNHHLFFADLAVKGGPMGEAGGIIPDYGAVIFDEAHDIEDVAGQYFGITRFDLPVRRADARRRRPRAPQELRVEGTGPHPDHARRTRGAILRTLRRHRRAHRVPLARSVPDPARRSSIATSWPRSKSWRCNWSSLRAAPEEAIPLVNRAREIARRLQFWMESGDKAYVYWIETPRPRHVPAGHAHRCFAIARRKAVRRHRHRRC